MFDENPIKEELETHFILRLPPEDAVKVSKYLKKKPRKVAKYLKIQLDPETREALIFIRRKVIPMKLMDLPTITESLKTTNNKVFFKTADICQILVPDTKENKTEKDDSKKDEMKNLCKHGITPPLKNVSKQRFRRVLKNEQSMDSSDIEKELRWLLKMDNDAIAVRWELIDDPDYKPKKNSDSYYEQQRRIFGEVVSDSSETDSD